jgi:hypothetical protein
MSRTRGPTLSSLFNQLLHTREGDLLINDEIFPKKVGTVTPPCTYKNGWKLIDVKGDGKYMQLNIYTASGGEVTYEHQMMLKRKQHQDFSTWTLVVLTGFNGIDLLKFDTKANSEKYVIEYLEYLLKRAVDFENARINAILSKYEVE